MFSWFVSLLLLLGYHGKAASVSSVDFDNSGNRHVAPADTRNLTQQSQPIQTAPAAAAAITSFRFV